MTQWAKVLDIKPYIFPGTYNGTKTEQTFPKLSSDFDTYAPTHPHNQFLNDSEVQGEYMCRQTCQ